MRACVCVCVCLCVCVCVCSVLVNFTTMYDTDFWTGLWVLSLSTLVASPSPILNTLGVSLIYLQKEKRFSVSSVSSRARRSVASTYSSLIQSASCSVML